MSEPRGVSGHLELVCDLDSRGLTRLRHQSFRAPVHLSKPYHDAGALVVNVVNPTAGLLDGDRLRIDVRVERGARVLLTTPSANRVHTMRAGHAEVSQSLRVEAGGSLDWWPELLIPQAGARYWQRTTLDVEDGGELLYFETLAPGRTASGESFAYDELRWATDLRVGERLVARERYRLSPGDASIGALRRRFPHAYYGGVFLVAPALTLRSTCWETLLALHGDEVWSGVSAPGEGVFVWKVVAADSLVFRRALRAGRAAIYAALERCPPALRRGDVSSHSGSQGH